MGDTTLPSRLPALAYSYINNERKKQYAIYDITNIYHTRLIREVCAAVKTTITHIVILHILNMLNNTNLSYETVKV